MISERVKQALVEDAMEKQAREIEHRRYVQLLDRVLFNADGTAKRDPDLEPLWVLAERRWALKKQWLQFDQQYRRASRAGGNGGVMLTEEAVVLLPALESLQHQMRALENRFQVELQKRGE